MRKLIADEILSNPRIKHIFSDYFDTIVHRTVHPNYVLRLWAKKMIQQLAMPLSIDELYFTRLESTKYLVSALKRDASEINYEVLISEIYTRLNNNNLEGHANSIEHFIKISEEVECSTEYSVQFLNDETVNTLKHLQSKGLKIYCVSDFYTSEKLIKKLIKAHGLSDIFEAVFVSSDQGFSKHVGGIYEHLLDQLDITSDQVTMFGDNYKSDFINAEKIGIKAYFIPNKDQKRIQKRLVLGNDTKDYNQIIKSIYTRCNSKTAPPYSDYVMFFALFTEKLYAECMKKKIKNLFFLAREGLYLKRFFDHYQEIHRLKHGHTISTHYLKMSRQSALQIVLKSIENEDFTYFRDKYKNISLDNFLKNFSFSTEDHTLIIEALNLNEPSDVIIKDFFNSETFEALLKNDIFKINYESNRQNQKKAFNNYLDSFNAPYQEEGVTLVDVGWGGTMQDKLHEYFDKKITVNGYYLGLKEFRHQIGHQEKNINRRGLNFEVNLFTSFSSSVMMANTELYEQLSQAPHGSTLGYKDNPDQYTIEYHEVNEKQVYDQYIKETQDFMFDVFKDYCEKTNLVCYNLDTASEIITKFALKIGTIIPKRKLNRVINLSKGFYDNIGNNEVGESLYEMNVLTGLKNKLSTFKNYIISPEQLIPYVMRTKLTLYTKNKLFFIPSFPLYYYILLNRFLKKQIGKKVYLKYAHFR
ncbi:HAD family hydrolase [Tamlana haliotis]|uniref:HAD family hydrolase n=1 Tax=Pseudotamlana haliotis TaxID=2614804 RepID=A0A6N6MMH4_9FLAO|nr:HAD family hydrolase [Tamlana haliotis]KAB1071333.1 HAD family hydrolase [Tamlana haliotis]